MRFFDMDMDSIVREQLRALLQGGDAHMTFEAAVANFPREHMNTKPPNVPYTPWQLLEHIRMAQWDILEFIRNPQYVSPTWPEGFWFAEGVQADETAWEKTLASLRADLHSLLEMVADPKVNLYTPIPHGEGQNILREILVVADHNAYHIGEFAALRQVMGTW
jgi:DinB family protein